MVGYSHVSAFDIGPCRYFGGEPKRIDVETIEIDRRLVGTVHKIFTDTIPIDGGHILPWDEDLTFPPNGSFYPFRG